MKQVNFTTDSHFVVKFSKIHFMLWGCDGQSIMFVLHKHKANHTEVQNGYTLKNFTVDINIGLIKKSLTFTG